ncbi:MAG: UDP-glucose 4-epimerase GalE [Sphingobacteriales bacterium]|jgi:UDP-glucose 4-epimerase
MKKILVTGGCGYIGSHTITDLLQNGFDVLSVDNNSRSSEHILEGVEKITGKKVKNYRVNLCSFDDIQAVFAENPDITGVIHFAAFKAVGESVMEPLSYYDNNMSSLINLLRCVEEYKTPYFVFSSSCTVYGNPDSIPVTEETAEKTAESPYGATKQMGERIIRDFAFVSKESNFVLLRYFNPAGAHPTNFIGEYSIGIPQNLTPVITQTAIGKIQQMQVFGNDYPTRDGSCIRDFIHVCDLAHAHTLALKRLMENHTENRCEVYNLGTGDGISVLEAISAFEKVSGQQLNYVIGPRRPGDVIAIYANKDKAERELNWKPKFGLEDIMRTAWAWEQKLKSDEQLHTGKNIELN